MENQRQKMIKRQLMSSFYPKNHLIIGVEVFVTIVIGILSVGISWLMQELMDVAALAPNARPLTQLVRLMGVVF